MASKPEAANRADIGKFKIFHEYLPFIASRELAPQSGREQLTGGLVRTSLFADRRVRLDGTVDHRIYEVRLATGHAFSDGITQIIGHGNSD